MPLSLHPTWHPMLVHFAVGSTLASSLLVIIGLVAKYSGYKDITRKLTFPLHLALLFSLITLVLACASALMDFPASTFAASSWFRFKTMVSIATFFVYSGMYLLVALRKENVWENNACLAYLVILALLGGGLVTTLSAAGGYLEYGHSVLEPVLKTLGLPMPRP